MTGLSKAELITDHKASLGKSAGKFTAANDADFERHLNKAVRAFSRIRRRTLVGTLSLTADESYYPAPADMIAPKVSKWGQGKLQPWDDGYARLPRMSMFEDAGEQMIQLYPAPTAFQICVFGSQYSFFYLAAHQIGDQEADTTVKDSDRDLLLLLATIEAVRELAASGISEPVQLHRGMGAVNSNMTPAALLEVLTKELERYR